MIGLLAAVAAVLLGALSNGYLELNHAVVLCASSLTTAFVAAFFLGELLVLFLTLLIPGIPVGPSFEILILLLIQIVCTWFLVIIS